MFTDDEKGEVIAALDTRLAAQKRAVTRADSHYGRQVAKMRCGYIASALARLGAAVPGDKILGQVPPHPAEEEDVDDEEDEDEDEE